MNGQHQVAQENGPVNGEPFSDSKDCAIEEMHIAPTQLKMTNETAVDEKSPTFDGKSSCVFDETAGSDDCKTADTTVGPEDGAGIEATMAEHFQGSDQASDQSSGHVSDQFSAVDGLDQIEGNGYEPMAGENGHLSPIETDQQHDLSTKSHNENQVGDEFGNFSAASEERNIELDEGATSQSVDSHEDAIPSLEEETHPETRLPQEAESNCDNVEGDSLPQSTPDEQQVASLGGSNDGEVSAETEMSGTLRESDESHGLNGLAIKNEASSSLNEATSIQGDAHNECVPFDSTAQTSEVGDFETATPVSDAAEEPEALNAAATTEEPETVDDDEEFGDFGAASSDNDFGDFNATPETDEFGDFDAAAHAENNDAAESSDRLVQQQETFEEDDEFGDFGAAEVASEDEFGDFDEAADAAGDDDNDDFGDFEEKHPDSKSRDLTDEKQQSEDPTTAAHPLTRKYHTSIPVIFERYAVSEGFSDEEDPTSDEIETKVSIADVLSMLDNPGQDSAEPSMKTRLLDELLGAPAATTTDSSPLRLLTGRSFPNPFCFPISGFGDLPVSSSAKISSSALGDGPAEEESKVPEHVTLLLNKIPDYSYMRATQLSLPEQR